MEYLKKKKIVVTVATVLLGTVATVQNLKKEKKKVAQQNGTINVQCKNIGCTLYVHSRFTSQ